VLSRSGRGDALTYAPAGTQVSIGIDLPAAGESFAKLSRWSLIRGNGR
jgi:hypothetical protein